MTSLKDRRISRRALLAGSGAAAAGLGAAALVGCGDDDDDEAPAPAATQAAATEAAATEAAATEAAATEAAATEAAATEAAATEAAATEAPAEGGPQMGGTLRGSAPTFIWNTGFPFSFTWENEPYFSVLEPLVRYRDSLDPFPVLAERFEYNDDRSKLTVTLKPDLEFHDGSPVTPEDVFHGIEVMLDPEPWGIAGRFQISSFAVTLTRWEAIDSRTMEFEFDKPRPNMTDFFAQLLVTKKDTYRELQEGVNIQGTGPFAFEQWTPDVGASFVANRGWHQSAVEGGPYLDRIELQNFPDTESLGLALEAGDIDWSLGVSPTVARRTGQGFLAPKAGIVYVGCVTTSPKLVDPRVRQALLYAIDRRRMTEELREGFGDLTAQPWPSSSPAFDPDLESELYEPDRARALLAEAGWSQDSPLMIEPIPGTEVTAEILKSNFADIGVEVEIVTQEIGVWVGKLRQRGFVDLWVAPHKFSNLSPLTTMQQTFPYRLGNPSYYETETYLDIIANLERLDPLGEEAKEQYARFNRMWLEDPWLLPVHTNQRIEVANANVKGYDEHFVTIFEQPNLAKVWLEG